MQAKGYEGNSQLLPLLLFFSLLHINIQENYRNSRNSLFESVKTILIVFSHVQEITKLCTLVHEKMHPTL